MDRGLSVPVAIESGWIHERTTCIPARYRIYHYCSLSTDRNTHEKGEGLAMYVVATGSPFDGISLFGPFQDFDDALDYMEGLPADSWAVDLNDPTEENKPDA